MLGICFNMFSTFHWSWLLHYSCLTYSIRQIVAKRLSTRLLILQRVFLVGGVWLWLPSHFRNAICHGLGMQLKVHVACAQTSVPLRNAIKILCLQKLCTLTQVYRSQCCSGASDLIVATSKWQKFVMRVRKKELGAWHKNGREDKV